MNATYPLLPTFPDAVDVETVFQRGARCLQWILREGVTVTVSDLDLERADIAAAYTVGAPDMLPQVREQISSVRHHIASTLAERRRYEKSKGAAIVGGGSSKPNLGPMAPLQPSPDDLPPAPVAAVRRPVTVDVGF